MNRPDLIPTDRVPAAAPLSRRSVLRGGLAAASAGAGDIGRSQVAAAQPKAKNATMVGVPFQPMRRVRVGVIGAGNRGTGMLSLFLRIPGVRVTAVCDRDAPRARRAADAVGKVAAQPATYTGGDRAFEGLCRRDDVDFVYVATPWEWHHPMASTALRNGKHVGVEIPMAMTLPEIWDLVDLSESTRRHCFQMENCCYGRNELRVLRMIHAGVFGDVLHAAGGYIHDLRARLFSEVAYARDWRRLWHTRIHGNLYPGHGLGPIASYLDINRGDRITTMTSVETPSLGLTRYRKAHVPPGDDAWRERYVTGDFCVSILRTARGRVMRLEHNVVNPRPYDRINSVAGTRGAFEDFPPRVYIEGDSPADQWGSLDQYAGYDHWLWKKRGDAGADSHGGMDYIMLERVVQSMRLGLVPDMDVYDGATWSAPIPLSGRSLAAGGMPVDFPDFTRGRWPARRPGPDSPEPG